MYHLGSRYRRKTSGEGRPSQSSELELDSHTQYGVSDSCYYLHVICKHNNQPIKHVILQWQRAVRHIQSADNEWHAKRQCNPQPRIATRAASVGDQSQTRSPTYFQAAVQPTAHVIQNMRPAAGQLPAAVGFQRPPSLHLGTGYLAGRSSQGHMTSLIQPAGCNSCWWGDTVVQLFQGWRGPHPAGGMHRRSGWPGQTYTSYKTVHSVNFNTVATNSMFYSQRVHRQMHLRA